VKLWRDLYSEAAGQLADPLAARWFVEEASGATWPSVLGERPSARAAQAFSAMVGRRLAGEPVQYVLGHWAFRKVDLMVDRRALIPRPETEVVVEVALEELARLEVTEPVVVDLGTGSGAIAASLLWEHPRVNVWATDVSLDALQVASANLSGLGVRGAGRTTLCQGSWWEALPASLAGRVDLVVANPPYIAEGERASLPAEVVDWEPHEALFAGPSGLEAVEAILASAADWLAPTSALVCEIAPHQAGPACLLAERSGFSYVSVRQDLAGRERVLVGRRLRPPQ
jgi:release factor glutamine methyltransferase